MIRSILNSTSDLVCLKTKNLFTHPSDTYALVQREAISLSRANIKLSISSLWLVFITKKSGAEQLNGSASTVQPQDV